MVDRVTLPGSHQTRVPSLDVDTRWLVALVEIRL